MKCNLTREAWRDANRDAVLAALDQVTRTATSHAATIGPTDADLPALFQAIDAQSKWTAERLGLEFEE